MMKILFGMIPLLVGSCNDVNDFYQGRVIDEQNKPLKNVLVSEDDTKTGAQTKTDGNGYFKLARTPQWLGTLIFYKAGYKVDSIPTVTRQSGERVNYSFINKNDTTTIVLEQVK
ncbi:MULTISPECIES: carboxypeptidase-like regulatory domain-containing protein [Sphingobacterium]|uniref:Carboxypeptidase regulatory-like domain-containing protein n=1 Tax=Sphingobacterium athyrii TaxID=2152717 RepID=A0A363NW81_9SPHI|nr:MULTISPECIES: carboxypeptidase-like regulatory domain-containing protein [Sphingobacterium]PUV25065.1 hypothetical protein DCO56_08980 [Sphingobacterium athyrii]QIH34853.1 carboxypeptidase regulatory-like domain-containing protein [Sphingobacterium sp. DR205]